jgi:hypothetical protein
MYRIYVYRNKGYMAKRKLKKTTLERKEKEYITVETNIFNII